jgi:hypothetical protein
VQLAHAAGDELGVLRAKIEDEDRIGHGATGGLRAELDFAAVHAADAHQRFDRDAQVR